MAKRPSPSSRNLVAVIVVGGVARGASGWGITPDGRIIRIPSNNPLATHTSAIAAALGAKTRVKNATAGR